MGAGLQAIFQVMHALLCGFSFVLRLTFSKPFASKLLLREDRWNHERICAENRPVEQELPGGRYALQEVSVGLEPGRIYGLIGQNVGKTTLMRLAAGLSFPTSGSLELFGHSGEKALQAERKRLGWMIQSPSITPSMTARDNLRHHRILRGIPNVEVEEELLAFVGLSNTGRKKSAEFLAGHEAASGDCHCTAWSS